MSWTPTEEEIEEKLIELAYAWGDVEEKMELASLKFDVMTPLAQAVGRAFRVEVHYTHNDFGDPCTPYVLLYDVADAEAREAVRTLDRFHLAKIINGETRTWHGDHSLIVRQVRRGAPVEGQICRRLGQDHPASREIDATDLPDEPAPEANGVPLVKRDRYWLTPIEVPFYDALRETGLFFAVQPWIQGTDRRYRLDFLVFYDAGVVAVELDGHATHKTKEQRRYDAQRDRWFNARGVRTLRWTGSEVAADPEGCVRELLDILRGSQARP